MYAQKGKAHIVIDNALCMTTRIATYKSSVFLLLTQVLTCTLTVFSLKS
jgi:hypothetical protein